LRPRDGDEGEYDDRWKVRRHRVTGIRIADATGVRVCGRGILDAGLVPHLGGSMIALQHARDVRLEGITLRDAASWNVTIANSDHVRVDDVRIIAARLNSDGINSVNSRQVRVRGCFVRNSDDSIVVKTPAPDAPVEEIEVEDCVVWNDWGYALGATYETRSPIGRVRFRSCDILFARHWCLGIHVSDGATVSDVSFADIEVAQLERTTTLPAAGALTPQPKLVRMVIQRDVWGKDAERGHIRDIRFDRITVDGDRLPPSELLGADAAHAIENVTFRAVRPRHQVAASSPAELGLSQNEFARQIEVRP
jgi:hypothetical protein